MEARNGTCVKYKLDMGAQMNLRSDTIVNEEKNLLKWNIDSKSYLSFWEDNS